MNSANWKSEIWDSANWNTTSISTDNDKIFITLKDNQSECKKVNVVIVVEKNLSLRIYIFKAPSVKLDLQKDII